MLSLLSLSDILREAYLFDVRFPSSLVYFLVLSSKDDPKACRNSLVSETPNWNSF